MAVRATLDTIGIGFKFFKDTDVFVFPCGNIIGLVVTCRRRESINISNESENREGGDVSAYFSSILVDIFDPTIHRAKSFNKDGVIHDS
jgi:hypothetical protein